MGSLIHRIKAAYAPLWRIDAPLAATAAAMVLVLAGCALGLALDPRMVTGAPVWLKPAKFAVSIAVYCVTLIWLFRYIPAFVRTRRIVGRGTALALLLEMAIIATQAARGTTSHFNASTPLDASLFAIMGIAIGAQTLATVAVVVALFRQRFRDRAFGWAARFGMVLTIVGASVGGVMTRPTQEQLLQMQAGQPAFSGAHTVGAPDGGPGLPVTGWSREHGDLRVPHFLGLHALQLLPLFALGLGRTRASAEQRVRLVFTFAGSYAALLGIVFWQALRGQPLLAPEASTLAALGTWLTLSGAATWRALASPAPAGAAVPAP